jgi:hypothetical protein
MGPWAREFDDLLGGAGRGEPGFESGGGFGGGGDAVEGIRFGDSDDEVFLVLSKLGIFGFPCGSC